MKKEYFYYIGGFILFLVVSYYLYKFFFLSVEPQSENTKELTISMIDKYIKKRKKEIELGNKVEKDSFQNQIDGQPFEATPDQTLVVEWFWNAIRNGFNTEHAKYYLDYYKIPYYLDSEGNGIY